MMKMTYGYLKKIINKNNDDPVIIEQCETLYYQ